jgi:hypothetical protein
MNGCNFLWSKFFAIVKLTVGFFGGLTGLMEGIVLIFDGFEEIFVCNILIFVSLKKKHLRGLGRVFEGQLHPFLKNS